MSSGNILWGSQNPIVFKNSFGVSNADTGSQDDLSQQNPFAEGYGVLLILLMVIQAIANNKFIEVQKNAERARNTQEKSNDANRNTDLMSQGQITIQKMSQELNAVLTQLTGLISKWGEISSMIAQKTYS